MKTREIHTFRKFAKKISRTAIVYPIMSVVY